MLVICNGAYKSGSSWLFHIVTELGDFGFPESEYLNPSWRVASIIPDKIEQFVSSHDLFARHYVCKQHLMEPRFKKILEHHDHVRLLDIERDIRDVIVSAYYHEVRRGLFAGSFAKFYWMQAPLIVKGVLDYHAFWREPAGKVLLLSYERLHADFAAEVGRLADFLGVPASPEKIEAVRQRTMLDQLQARSGEESLEEDRRHYRKGLIGDWRNQLSPPMLEDLEGLIADGVPVRRRLFCSVRRKLHQAVRVCSRTSLRQVSAAR